MITARTMLLVLLVGFSASAISDELTPGKRTDIERLLEMTNALAIGQQMSAATVEQMTRMLRQARADIPQRVLDVLPEEVNAVISENIATFKEGVIQIYHKHFTSAEIKETIRFYSSDVGQKTIRVMPTLLSESMQAGQQWGQSLGPILQQRIRARFRKEGYEL